MRLTLRLAAGAAVAIVASTLTAPIASAADGCTPIDNRSGVSRIATSPRAGTAIVTASANDVPMATVNGNTIVSTIHLTDTGIVRTVKIKDLALSHNVLSDITLRLRAPDGTLVLLANSLAGANMVSTAFSDAAPSIFVGLPPYTGTFAPQEWLAQLFGETIAGDWKLEVTDAAGGPNGSLNAWTLELAPEACGAQPVAAINATPNPVAPGGTVTFDAGDSAPSLGATITRYEWDLDGNGTFETDTATTPTTTQSYAFKGTYAISVRVTDDQGNSDQRTIALAVTAKPNAAINVDPASPLSLVNATLDASASYDSDGTVVRYEWDLDGDGTYEVDAGNIPTIQRLFGTSGPRTVRVLVTDDSGAQDVAVQSVLVQNRPPLAAFAPQSTPAIVGADTVLDAATSADLDGTIVNHEWDFDNDGTYETSSGGSNQVTHVFPGSGSYVVGLRITDNGTDTSATTRTIIATQAPVPVVGASTLMTRPGAPVTFDPAGSADPDVTGGIVSYAWDFDGDGTIDQTTSGPAPVMHSYTAFGLFTARLTVTDDLGATGTTTVVINVYNEPPVAALSISPSAVLTGESVTFSGAGSLDPDGAIAKYEFDLDGNGTYEVNAGATPTLVRSFPNRMRVTVRVRVTDTDGATAVATGLLSVDPAPAPPTPPGTGGAGAGAGGNGSGAGGTGDDGSGPAPGASFTASLSGASIQTLRRVIRKGVGVRCHVDRKATCRLEIIVRARDAKRLRLAKGKKAKRPVRIARGRASAAGSGSKAVTLKLSAKARKVLRRARRVVVIVQGTATDGDGGKATLSRAIMLRR